MAEIAGKHFESIGKGLTQKEGGKEDTIDRCATEGTGRESKAREPFEELQSHREVEEAIKRMKWGKGVGVIK